MKKERTYHVEYWDRGSMKRKNDFAFKSYNQAYQWADVCGYKILTVKFIGWK